MTTRTARRLVVAATAVFVAFTVPVLGDWAWRHADEVLYTDAAIGMLEHGDLTVARSADGAPRFHKPLLTYWAVAASFRLFGIGLAASRAAALLATVLLAWVTWRTALVWLRDPAAALLAVVVLLAHPETAQLATRATPDILLCLFVSACLLGIARLLAQDDAPPGAARWAWTGAGLAVATKGLPGVLAFAYGLAVLAAVRGLRPLLRPGAMAFGTALAAAGTLLPWVHHGPVAVQGFYDDQLRARALASSLGAVLRNFGGQLAAAVVGLLPWTALMAAAGGAFGRALRRCAPVALFGLGWATLLLGLSALPQFTRPRYLAPANPLLAVVCAGVLATLARDPASAGRLRALTRGALGLIAAAAVCWALAASRIAGSWAAAGVLVAGIAVLALRRARTDVAPLVALGGVVLLAGGLLRAVVHPTVSESPVPALAACLTALGPRAVPAVVVGNVGPLPSELRLVSHGRLRVTALPGIAHLHASDSAPAVVIAPEDVARRLEAQGWQLRPCGREVRARRWALAEWWALVRSGDRETVAAAGGRRFFLALR